MPKKGPDFKKITIALSLFVFLLIPLLKAEDVNYDRYAPVWTHGPLAEPSSHSGDALATFGKHFLVYPFELVRWPIDKALIFAEDYHLYDKGDWVYQQLKNHGTTPKIRSLMGRGMAGEVDVEILQLTGVKEKLPDSSLKLSGMWSLDHIIDYQVRLKQERIAGTGFFAGGILGYQKKGEEHFYGIGPDTSLGDGTSYRLEKTTLALPIGYEIQDRIKIEGRFAYDNVNITNGEDGGSGIIDEIFVLGRKQQIPGLGGDEILRWGINFEHDNRNSKDLPTTGGYERLHFSFNKGIESSAGYFKYRAEAAHFMKVFSERQVMGIRGVFEHNNEVPGRDVPFFDMPRLGGFGAYPQLGDVQRGFRRDRFYDESLMLLNLEYRWTVWNYRDWRMDSVLFWDEGQVFGDFSNFQWKDFSSSYGTGLRIALQSDVLLDIELARSHEGTQLYVKTRTPF